MPSYQKRSFIGVLTSRKLNGINMLNAKETVLKKVNVLFIAHICLYKYMFSYFFNTPCISIGYDVSV